MLRSLAILLAVSVIPVILIRPGLYKRPYRHYLKSDNITRAFFNQTLDHFSLVSNSTNYFSQQYLYSTLYTNNKKNVFLFVSNEGSLEETMISDEKNPIVKNAKQFGATIFALEHRFYGLSKPFDVYDAHNLQYLNSLHATYDILSFIKFANKQFGLDSDVKWILFGVGYGGTLAAQARSANPSLIAGAIASSAPMERKYDFWEFNDVVKTEISSVDNCYNNVYKGFSDIASSMISPDGRANISNIFKLNPSFVNSTMSYNEIQQFYEIIISPFQQIVQFNGELFKISDLCNIMANNLNSPMQNVYNVYLYTSQLENNQNAVLVTDYQQIVNLLSNTNGSNPLIDDRLWCWQVCTELGLFLTTNSDISSVFGNVVPNSLFVNQCRDIFPDANLSATNIRDEINNYNSFFGGSQHYTGTNVVFTYGEGDPFYLVGKQTFTDFSVVTYNIAGASFASDFFPGNLNNTFIDKAHQIINDNIDSWLTNASNRLSNVDTKNRWTMPKEIKNEEGLFSKLRDDVPSKKIYPKGGLKRILLGRPPHGFNPAPEYNSEIKYPPGFEVGSFKQRVDHFDNTNPDHFEQKYFKNSQWAKEGGPNFLMIGGEGPESERWVLNENITYLTWAKKYGATVYLLEHRFYGDSVVGDNTEFKYLTSLQMLYDLAEFIRAVNRQSANPSPWITFGGSYSGAMSVWMRETFPDLVIGAVGSSGPVFAKTDFFEYLMVVEDATRTYSSDCADNIKSAFELMHQLFLSKEGRDNLTTTFTLTPPFGVNVTQLDEQYFFSNIYSNFQGAVQYSGDNTGLYATGYGIPDMCRIMTNTSNDPLQNVAAFNEYMTIFYNGEFQGTDNSYEDLVDSLRNAQLYGPDSAAGLLWTWQTCNEFGYFQSADSGNGIFGSPTPVTMYIKLCEDLFNHNRQTIDALIGQTNEKYGSRFNYKGSNVVVPNGNVDPWHALGLYYSTDSSVVSYLINGTAHCADMYPARDEDVPELKVVRDLIDNNIAKWLQQTPSANTTTTLPYTESTVTFTTDYTRTTTNIVFQKSITTVLLFLTSMLIFN